MCYNLPEFLNDKVTEWINERWFFVYEYLNFLELNRSMKKIYHSVIMKTNKIMFYWFFMYFMFLIMEEKEMLKPLLTYTAFSYWIVFLLVLLIFIFKMHSYSKLKDAIYVKNWILIWNVLLKYNNTKWLHKYLKIAENNASKGVITKFIPKYFFSMWSKANNWLINSINHQISIIIYYLWIALWIIIYPIFLFVMLVSLKLFSNKASKIKMILIELDNTFSKISKETDKLILCIKEEKLIWKSSFDKLFSKLDKADKKMEELNKKLNMLKYWNLIDKKMFKTYLKWEYNRSLSRLSIELEEIELDEDLKNVYSLIKQRFI